LSGPASRAEIVERRVAGAYTREKGIIEATIAATLFGVYAVAVGLLVVAAIHRWSRDRQGEIAIYALAGLQIFLYFEMKRRGDAAFNYVEVALNARSQRNSNHFKRKGGRSSTT
jgi:hypothetical protein